MADIEKALRRNVQLSLQDIADILPHSFKRFAAVFNQKDSASLPPHGPGIDHEMPLKKEGKGRKKSVPWEPLYNMSHEELLVFCKQLKSLLD